MKKIRDCIGLLTVMVSAGEQHSEESLTMVHDAFDEAIAMQKVVDAARTFVSECDEYEAAGNYGITEALTALDAGEV